MRPGRIAVGAQRQGVEGAGAGQERVRVLSYDPHLNGTCFPIQITHDGDRAATGTRRSDR